MCGRLTLTDDSRERVAAVLGVPPEQLTQDDYRPRRSTAPTDPHWIVRMLHHDRIAEPVPACVASRVSASGDLAEYR